MNEKTLIVLIIAIVLLFPVRFNLDDGGTVKYEALVYEYSKVKQSASVEEREDGKMYYEGTVLEVLGFEIYNNVK